MSQNIIILILLLVHIIGGIITLCEHCKSLKKDKTDEIIPYSDIVAVDLIFWEVQLIIVITGTIDSWIDDIFRKKYNK